MNSLEIIYSRIFKKNNKGSNTYRFWDFISSFIVYFLIVFTVFILLNFFEALKKIEFQDGHAKVIISKELNSNNKQDKYFEEDEIKKIQNQKFIEKEYPILTTHFPVHLKVAGMFETLIFFEGINAEAIDVEYKKIWHWDNNEIEVPILLGEDLLQLYNFGFAPSQGFPSLSKENIGQFPLEIILGNEYKFKAKIVGTTNLISSVLVPQNFIETYNLKFGESQNKPARILLKLKPGMENNLSIFLNENKLKTDARNLLLKKIAPKFYLIGFIFLSICIFMFVLYVWLQGSLLKNKILENNDKLKTLFLLGHSKKGVISYLLKKEMYKMLVVFVFTILILSIFQFLIYSYAKQNFLDLNSILSYIIVVFAFLLGLIQIQVLKHLIEKTTYKYFIH